MIATSSPFSIFRLTSLEHGQLSLAHGINLGDILKPNHHSPLAAEEVSLAGLAVMSLSSLLSLRP